LVGAPPDGRIVGQPDIVPADEQVRGLDADAVVTAD